MVTPEDIKTWIEAGLPESQATVTGDGHHFEALVVCPAFAGQSMIACHRMVYDTLGSKMGNEVHALSIKTQTPN